MPRSIPHTAPSTSELKTRGLKHYTILKNEQALILVEILHISKVHNEVTYVMLKFQITISKAQIVSVYHTVSEKLFPFLIRKLCD